MSNEQRPSRIDLSGLPAERREKVEATLRPRIRAEAWEFEMDSVREFLESDLVVAKKFNDGQPVLMVAWPDGDHDLMYVVDEDLWNCIDLPVRPPDSATP